MEGSVGYALDYSLACLRFSGGEGAEPPWFRGGGTQTQTEHAIQYK